VDRWEWCFLYLDMYTYKYKILYMQREIEDWHETEMFMDMKKWRIYHDCLVQLRSKSSNILSSFSKSR
jgi:hypothetical protein